MKSNYWLGVIDRLIIVSCWIVGMLFFWALCFFEISPEERILIVFPPFFLAVLAVGLLAGAILCGLYHVLKSSSVGLFSYVFIDN